MKPAALKKNISILSLVIGALTGCGIKDGESTLGKYSRDANFPMHYIAGGDIPGNGALYRIDEVSVGQSVASDFVIGGLTAPGGLVQDFSGNIYISETLPEPDGRILKLRPDGNEFIEVITGLDYPTGVAVDSFNQLYVLENGKQRILKFDAIGVLSEFIGSEISSPEDGVFDSNDNLFLVEASGQIVSKISPNGERTIVSPIITGLLDTSLNSGGRIFVLETNQYEGTGKVLKVTDSSTTEEILTDLVSPLAIIFDNANALYIAEGAPANRISRYIEGEANRRVIITTEGEPRGITFSPR
jgi:sugar lactone lactonase YvrE